MRSVFAVLFELDEIRADEPVAQDEVAIHRARGAVLRVQVRLGDG